APGRPDSWNRGPQWPRPRVPPRHTGHWRCCGCSCATALVARPPHARRTSSGLYLRHETGYQRSRGIGAFRYCAEMLEHKFIPADFTFFFQKKLAGHAVDIYHIRNGRLGELQESEGTGHARVRPGAERYDLQRDLGKLGRLQQVPELPAHHFPAADLPPQRGLVDDPPELERAVAAQDVL